MCKVLHSKTSSRQVLLVKRNGQAVREASANTSGINPGRNSHIIICIHTQKSLDTQEKVKDITCFYSNLVTGCYIQHSNYG